MRRKIALSFMLAVALALVTSGPASAALVDLAIWNYNTQPANNNANASSGNAVPSADSVATGWTGTQFLVGITQAAQFIGYNDGGQPSGGTGDYSVDGASGTADKRIRWNLPTTSLGTGLGWTLTSATSTINNFRVELGVYIGSASTLTTPVDFKFEYKLPGGSWTAYAGSGVTSYATKGTWVTETMDLSSLGNVNGIDFRFLYNSEEADAATVTLDYVHVTADPTAVPIPAAAWLLGSGLLGLVGIRRRMRK
jgi:hypothetical protein